VTRRSPILVGPYSYTVQDAHKTVGALAALWQHHRHDSTIPNGWLAGARGFLAESASLAGIDRPAPDDLDTAFRNVTDALLSAWSRLDDSQVEALIAAMWRLFPTMRALNVEHTGHVAHLHASKGLPKKAIESADIGWGGVGGDVQSARAHHGRPWQALCIWSTDAIDTLRAEGHPIAPGCAGENITVAGIPARAFRPGAQFRIGAVRGFLTSYSIPCSQNNDWFLNRDFNRMSHERGDQSRLYAMVTATGIVRPGDTFELFTDR
jgi:MOSC domain-containing protein YiiM